mgnify:CR=1 FL=1
MTGRGPLTTLPPAWSTPATVSKPLGLGGVDEFSILVRSILEGVKDDRTIVFQLSDGTGLRGVLHESWTLEEARAFAARTLDLHHAYKQLLAALPS